MNKLVRPIPEYRVWIVMSDAGKVGSIVYHGPRSINAGYSFYNDRTGSVSHKLTFAAAKTLALGA